MFSGGDTPLMTPDGYSSISQGKRNTKAIKKYFILISNYMKELEEEFIYYHVESKSFCLLITSIFIVNDFSIVFISPNSTQYKSFLNPFSTEMAHLNS